MKNKLNLGDILDQVNELAVGSTKLKDVCVGLIKQKSKVQAKDTLNNIKTICNLIEGALEERKNDGKA